MDNKFVELNKSDVALKYLNNLKETLLDIIEERKNNKGLVKEVKNLVDRYNIILKYFSVEVLD